MAHLAFRLKDIAAVVGDKGENLVLVSGQGFFGSGVRPQQDAQREGFGLHDPILASPGTCPAKEP